MGCLTVHLPHEITWNTNLMQQGVRCGWSIRTAHTTHAAAVKNTTHPKTRCRKPYAATQHLMLLMMGVCTRNISNKEYINKITLLHEIVIPHYFTISDVFCIRDKKQRNIILGLMSGYTQIVCILLSVNPLNAKLNPICHLLALLRIHHILHVGRIRVKSPVICLDKQRCFFIL